MDPIKVLIADDHKIFREGIISLLKPRKDIQIVGEAENGKQVISALQTKEVDVVLLDINMPEMNGIDTAAIILKQFPKTNILVFSSYDDDRFILKMLQIGVCGYVLKTTSSRELINAIKTIANGDSYYCKEAAMKIKEQFIKRKSKTNNKEELLTERELEILKLVAKGYTNTKIGERLFISPRTVDTHRRNLMQKLNVHSAVELTHYAHKHKLIP